MEMEKILMPAITRTDSFPDKGRFQFNLNFKEDLRKPTKSCLYTYSHRLNKLYVQPNHIIEIPFTSFYLDTKKNWNIQSFLIFKSIVHRNEVVMRCPNHLEQDKNTEKKHFVLQCQEPNTEFFVPKKLIFPGTKHYINILPIPGNILPNEENSFSLKFIFACSSVCQGGINRRPLILVFNLCERADVVDQIMMDISICSCPGRDRINQEEKQINRLTTIKKMHKKRRFSEGCSNTFGNSSCNDECTSIVKENEDYDDKDDDNQLYTVTASSEKNLALLESFNKLMDVASFQYPYIFQSIQKRVKSSSTNEYIGEEKANHKRAQKVCSNEKSGMFNTIQELKKISYQLDMLKGIKTDAHHSCFKYKNEEQLCNNNNPEVESLSKYLLTEHYFCYWCSTFYYSASSITCHCLHQNKAIF
ncbi:cellular tumor antigen p53 [Hydra vulgaris]|uniref:cellular tumor antigen p53 n=1 Tax=Hydra vulgaris TaxID=6087 RepID=UPI001F5F7A87|nr:cellular tumor antigen p53 [Hydra vulgaris]